MSIKSGQAVAAQFCTLDSAGALVAPSAGPTGTLIVNGVNNAAVVTISNISTGVYSWSVTLPVLSAGDIVQIRIAATIGVGTGDIVWQDVADTKRVSDLNDLAAGALMGLANDAITAAAIAADAIGASELAASAVTKIQLGLAVEATLTALKGAGWTDETLKAIYDLTNTCCALGSGPIAWPYYVVSSVDGSPISNCWVGVYTDIAMTNLIRAGYTDEFGLVTFNFWAAGTYYFQRLHPDFSFSNPDTEVVS